MIERSDIVLEAEKEKVESIPLKSRFLCVYYLVLQLFDFQTLVNIVDSMNAT